MKEIINYIKMRKEILWDLYKKFKLDIDDHRINELEMLEHKIENLK